MTASALTIPEPLPDDPDAVTTALETAAIFGTQGDAREAVRWVRRAAEAAGDEGNDLRALSLARLAADLTSQIGDGSVAPAAATNGASAHAVATDNAAALDAALGVVPSAPADPLANTVPNAPDLGLAPTVSAQPPAASASASADAPATNAAAEAPAPPSPEAEAASAAPVPAPPAWIPPAPPPPVTAAASEGSVEQPADPVAAPVDASPAPAGSLRAALQRFSQHATNPSVPAAASQPAQPDLQQSPALAALVQSIARSQPAPAANSGSARPAGGLRPQAPLTPRSPLEPLQAEVAEGSAVIAPVAELERTPPGGLLAPPSEPSDAITDPRYIPSVAAKGDFGAPVAPAQVATAAPAKVAVGARRAVRASIAATTEEGVYVLELLKDGQSPAAGHEALVVLVDPDADLFD